MRKAISLVFVLSIAASTSLAQTPAAPPIAAGGSYYEFLMGMHLESAGDNAGAAAAYQRAERLDPKSAEIPAALAELYARMNRPADAIAAGERALSANPESPEANWILGTLLARMAEMPTTADADRRTYTQRAIASLEKANRNAHPVVPMMLGRLYIAGNQHEKAIALLVPFVAEQPEQAEAVALLAEAYQATDRDADAIALLEKIREFGVATSALLRARIVKGRTSQATLALLQACDIRPSTVRVGPASRPTGRNRGRGFVFSRLRGWDLNRRSEIHTQSHIQLAQVHHRGRLPEERRGRHAAVADEILMVRQVGHRRKELEPITPRLAGLR